jgi:hypothetical protein
LRNTQKAKEGKGKKEAEQKERESDWHEVTRYYQHHY